MEVADSTVEVAVHTRGAVSRTERAYAQEKVAHLRRVAPGPVLFAKVDLTAEADPARERPAVAKAELDVNGRLVCARVAAGTMFAAVDLLEARLRQRLERLAHHEEAKHLRARQAERGEPTEWRHGDPPTHRPGYYPRPVEERELVRHKTFAVDAMTPDEAAFDLELLDHDFYLFTSAETGEECVLCRGPDGRLELIATTPVDLPEESPVFVAPSPRRPAVLALEDAIGLLDLGDEPFIFFLDGASGRGRVVYRRYDGHYGLITPSDEAG